MVILHQLPHLPRGGWILPPPLSPGRKLRTDSKEKRAQRLPPATYPNTETFSSIPGPASSSQNTLLVGDRKTAVLQRFFFSFSELGPESEAPWGADPLQGLFRWGPGFCLRPPGGSPTQPAQSGTPPTPRAPFLTQTPQGGGPGPDPSRGVPCWRCGFRCEAKNGRHQTFFGKWPWTA